MIVQCPSCASRYRVNEANIPSSGGRIRCPSCEHAFVVYPQAQPSFEDDADDKTSVIMSPNLHEMMANHQKNIKPKATPAFEHEEEESMTEVMDPSDIPALADSYDAHYGHQPALMGDDRTIEMTGPLNLDEDSSGFRGDLDKLRDDGQTTELTANALKKGLQAAAAARHLAANAGGSAPPPMPMPGTERTTRIPATSRELPAVASPSRPFRPTPHASPHTLQKIGQRPERMASGKFEAAESISKSGIRFPSEPAGARSFGEEPVVRPPAGVPGPTAQTQVLPPDFRPALGDSDETGVNMMAPVMVLGGVSESDAQHVGPWHLRTNFGLTYEFPDTHGLRSWLSNRDELEGVTLSVDGNEFFDLGHFPQTQSVYAPAGRPAQGGSAPPANFGNAAGLNASQQIPGGQRLTSTPFSTADGQLAEQESGFSPGQYSAAPRVPDPGSRITPEVYQPQSGGSKAGLLLWPVLIVLIAFAIALILQTVGIIDLKSAIFGDEPTSVSEPFVAEPVREFVAPVDPQADLRDQEAERARQARNRDQFERIILTSQEDIDANRLQIASEKLVTAKALEPDNIAVHEMLVDVYTRLGQTKLAEEASATLLKLREKPLPPAGE